MKTITLNDLANNFDCDVSSFGERFVTFYNTLDMSYESVEGESYDNLILECLQKLDIDKQVIGAPERTGEWFDGWKENLDDFLANGTRESLVPRFVRPNKVVRYQRKFIKPSNPYFERDFCKLIQIFCYDNFMKKENVDNVYEFGCGSSFNIMELYDLSKEDGLNLNFYGSDFVESSVNLLNSVGARYDAPLSAELFNMIEPNYDYEIRENSCVFTFGTIEQLDSKFKNYINFLIHKKPKICFHIEPTVENYDENNLFDYLQIKFHTQRGYTQGLVPYIEELEKAGKVDILKKKRLDFGSKFMEGYHLIVWSPKFGS